MVQKLHLEGEIWKNYINNCSSDWFVSPLNPLDGIQIAVTHRLIDGSREPWNPNEIITLEEALYIYTRGSSFVNFLEKETGILEVGKDADFIILDKDLFNIPLLDLHKVIVKSTFVKGVLLFKVEQ